MASFIFNFWYTSPENQPVTVEVTQNKQTIANVQNSPKTSFIEELKKFHSEGSLKHVSKEYIIVFNPGQNPKQNKASKEVELMSELKNFISSKKLKTVPENSKKRDSNDSVLDQVIAELKGFLKDPSKKPLRKVTVKKIVEKELNSVWKEIQENRKKILKLEEYAKETLNDNSNNNELESLREQIQKLKLENEFLKKKL